MAAFVAVWLTIGVFRDLRERFRSLAVVQRNAADDGIVRHHHNSGEEPKADEDARG